MHESVLARAALPAPTVCLGMLLHPYSLGHELWLLREHNPLLRADPGTQDPHPGPLPSDGRGRKVRTFSAEMILALPAAVLICSQTWEELAAMRRDWLLGVKLWIWRMRTRRARSATPYLNAEVIKFAAYREEGLLEFPLSEIVKPDKSSPSRMPGAPFILRLHQWLMRELRLSEAAAWDYPAGLAKMRWATHWEEEGGLDIYNAHDAEFDRFVQQQEAKNL